MSKAFDVTIMGMVVGTATNFDEVIDDNQFALQVTGFVPKHPSLFPKDHMDAIIFDFASGTYWGL